MSETKAAKQQQSDGELKRIESPLAKYNDAGQLMCVLCRSIVRSAAVWKVHIHSKQHKENNELAKKLKDGSAVDSVELRNAPNANLKRTGDPDTGVDSVPVKKIKGILKNSRRREQHRTHYQMTFSMMLLIQLMLPLLSVRILST